ncbi:CCHC-type domain-containing protein [Abeliophyllum distichum]|uniref:CCHC-type domain-containing protein n=1 Tax=Abeliophyllum distichum TaxID=126358 RepID=A0ABD1SH04_9LAMI
MNTGTKISDHLSILNGIFSELDAIGVKLNDEDKSLRLIWFFPSSYEHIKSILMYEKETVNFEEVISKLISKERSNFIYLANIEIKWLEPGYPTHLITFSPKFFSREDDFNITRFPSNPFRRRPSSGRRRCAFRPRSDCCQSRSPSPSFPTVRDSFISHLLPATPIRSPAAPLLPKNLQQNSSGRGLICWSLLWPWVHTVLSPWVHTVRSFLHCTAPGICPFCEEMRGRCEPTARGVTSRLTHGQRSFVADFSATMAQPATGLESRVEGGK